MKYIKYVALSLILFLGLGYMAVQVLQVPTVTEEACLSVTGVLEKVKEGPSYDVVFKLKDIDRSFYINRGLQYGLTMEQLESLVNSEITLKYPDHFSTKGKSASCLMLKSKDVVLYDVTKQD